MIVRCIVILSCSLLAACATYPAGRGIPAPIESRSSVDATTPQQVDINSTSSGELVPIQRQELPPRETPSIRSPAIVAPAPSQPSAPASASSTLLASVDAAIAQGDLERAAALCERALRINPRDATFWFRLASLRARQGRFNDAEGMARRALSYSADDPALTTEINALLRDL